ncbi:tellurite resistance TerB family protein [Cohnella herbarum]|uniref:Tellurite resistance TerB family protein n=1 Tax=Cohnella herbarum TaxID=2728023 RepID=A0A7Z2VI86_9BACL|nr:tellurite resistance TerB family protein [Cohnella herbarum]QJD83713.1 tellurite resistance TerB family protein [Cohnella herbarum]
MSTFSQKLTSMRQGLKDQVSKFKNKDFMDAVVAGCAIVAAADGKIDGSEKQKMIGYINHNEELKVFEISKVIERFNHYTSNFDFDHMIGKAEAMKPIIKFKDKPEARVVISVCCAIGAADGDFDESEKNVVREMCRAVNLPAGDFGL